MRERAHRQVVHTGLRVAAYRAEVEPARDLGAAYTRASFDDCRKGPRVAIFDAVRILDLTTEIAGPYATMFLADHGADVIKIERKGAGDDARRMPPFVAGESAPFMVWNRNKRSIELDFKTKEGQETLLELADGADILIENFRPGTLDKLGVGYDVMQKRNPRLIYAAISGFGQTGPYKSRGGFDLMTQGMSGLMSTCGPAVAGPSAIAAAVQAARGL